MSQFTDNQEIKKLDAELEAHVHNLVGLRVETENLIADLRKQADSENKTSCPNECSTNSCIANEEKSCCAESIEWPVDRVRETFIKFFVERHQHVFWPSSPVVPLDDPTLFFANSGMNQYKPLFLGTADPSLPMSRLTRAVNTQKCIRAGGKHNDLDDVGKDVYHHTFFEMLGNWSFGSYFKQEAIAWAWECLIDVFHLNPDRLYATYFGGSIPLNLPADEDARQIWLQYLPPSRVLPYGAKENFWEMGDTGPCGPCTEIHYDRIGNRDASALVNADDPTVIEIWNNVFIQFNRMEDKSLRELPNKHVDTGMGLERLTSILQGKMSNYDTDIFVPIFDAIHASSKVTPYSGLVGRDDVDKKDMAYRVVADHIRTLTFAITDGAIPSNDGRGYILRRILRRAVRYGQQILGTQPGFFSQLVDVVIDRFGGAFSELCSKRRFVKDVILQEEQSFNRTLDKGIKHFNKIVKEVRDVDVACRVFPGKAAHFLYTTMGFPVDLTGIMAEELGMTIDRIAFQAGMDEESRISELAEMARKGHASREMEMEAEQTAWLQQHGITPTDGTSKFDWNLSISTTILAIYAGKTLGFNKSATDQNGIIGLVLSSSPFYYESGGQIYDTGVIVNHHVNNNNQLQVTSVQSYAGYVLHIGFLETGSQLSVGDHVICGVNYTRRSHIAPNHTMTHVLNYALRSVLNCQTSTNGQTCDQKGSFVDENKLRFDFSWNSALTPLQVQQVETIVNSTIAQQLTVFTETVPIQEASNIVALRHVFGEKYPEAVRVVSIGHPIQPMLMNPTDAQWYNYSIEFCGGTHLSNTAEAELFQLLEEGSIAKGIRRIVAVTRDSAKQAKLISEGFLVDLERIELMGASDESEMMAKRLKSRLETLELSLVDKHVYNDRLDGVLDVVKKWRKVEGARRLVLAANSFESLMQSRGVGGVMVARIDFGGDMKLGKKLVSEAAVAHGAECFFLASADEANNKVTFFAAVGEGCRAAGKSASQWMAAAMEGEGGKAGGTAEFASGSVEGIEKVGRVMERAGHV